METSSQIHNFDPKLDSRWDALSACHGCASVFHSVRWARALMASYDHNPIFLASVDDNRPRTLLPILEVNSLLKGRRGVSLPFSDEAGMLCFDGDEGRDVFEHALELGRQRRWKYLEVRNHMPCYPQVPACARFVGHEVSLTGGAEVILSRCESSVRRAIRKAEKSKVRTDVFRSLDSVRTYYKLHCQTRRKHGVPPQAFSFFKSIFEYVIKPGGGFVCLAHHEDRPVAAGIFLHHGRVGMYKFGASDEASLHLRGNDLVMWAAMRACSALGCDVFSMGRTAPENGGLRRFKCGFGAQEKQIVYHRYDLRREAFVVESSQTGAWVSRLLRLMPMPVFRGIGRILYSQMD